MLKNYDANEDIHRRAKGTGSNFYGDGDINLSTHPPAKLETLMDIATEPQDHELSPSESIATKNSAVAYGLGSFGLESLFQVFAGFYVFYYTDKLGLAVTLAAIINIVYGVWDAVDDPIIGFLSDNTRTRWGRRRPWLLTGLPLYAGLLVLVYAVPKPFQQGNALFWYALVIFCLFEVAYSVMSVNYSALFPELFPDFKERARASSYYQSLSRLGELVGFSAAPFIYARFGFAAMAVTFAGVSGIALLVGIVRSKEDPTALKSPPLDMKSAFGKILKDRPFLLYTVAVTFLTYITGVFTLATPFWIKYTLVASPQSTSLVFATVFITAILSASVWGRFVQALGLRQCWLLSICLMASAAIILGAASNLILGAIGAAVVGASMGGIQVCHLIIVANFVDRDLERTGHRREGIYYSLLRVLGKFSKIVESLALLLLGLLFGYVNGQNPGPQPGNAFRFLMSVIPLCLTFIAWLLSTRLTFENAQSPPQR